VRKFGIVGEVATKSRNDVAGMNAWRVMGVGTVKPDGGHGDGACGGYRSARATEATAGCPRQWEFTSGDTLRMT